MNLIIHVSLFPSSLKLNVASTKHIICLQQLAGISAASVTKLGKNENVNTEIIEKICVALQCDVSDIMEMADED